ncbi:hypothetical protein [Brevundimonas faecalis]|uniref:Uncharacterized protein n=1 Tax=Brevundimonas faecalis TaxID=947378 RepID=A0ABV2RDZ2_9CAUL
MAGVALLLWLPLTFFVGLLLFSELKAEERRAWYWAFPIFIKRDQLAPHGVKLLSLYRFLVFGFLVIWSVGMIWGLVSQRAAS